MAKQDIQLYKKANESVSKFKLLSAYGGAGSLVHTQYGSIIVSCIEEWGFIKRVLEIHNEAVEDTDNDTEEKIHNYVVKHSRLEKNGGIEISNDKRLLKSLKERKSLDNLRYLSLIPDLSIRDYGNTIKEDGGVELAISSTFMPKLFSDKQNNYNSYFEWFEAWKQANKDNDCYGQNFFPPKNNKGVTLKQDNIVLICEHGHISDFPWSKFLRWRTDNHVGILNKEIVDLFDYQNCCGSDDNPSAKIKITASSANASGFDGKWLKCSNCGKGVSLKGLMSVKIKCPGHKPWEVETGDSRFYSGDKNARESKTSYETCKNSHPMKVALTTGNNLYYSRTHTSIFMPEELFEDDIVLEIKKIELEISNAVKQEKYSEAEKLNKKKTELLNKSESAPKEMITQDSEKEILFKYQEFEALSQRSENEINVDRRHLKVKDVTKNLSSDLSNYFSRILRVDNMKITSAQLDFSRVVPADADAENMLSKNIFRTNRPENVIVYPVVENFGEGIFFSFNCNEINKYADSEEGQLLIEDIKAKLLKLKSESNSFNQKAIEYGDSMNWQLYLVHSFAHLIMRELEFRCGYPTASLSERIYVSNDSKYEMYGCMIYTSEGAEGSMGGLIAQTREANLNNLIRSALMRSTVCHSDPLCWESEGQGLFDLNFASCFSCSLVSETSCEHRNLYLDRRILVDQESGFFKNVINNLG